MTLDTRDVRVCIRTEETNRPHGRKPPWPQHATTTPIRKRSTSWSSYQVRRSDNSTWHIGRLPALRKLLLVVLLSNSQEYRLEYRLISATRNSLQLVAVTNPFRCSPWGAYT